MNYFYHGVPESMKGYRLIPLNEMMSIDPGLRAKYLEKYKGREDVLEKKIPLLDCLWNDVVQLLPLHPKKLFEAQHTLGIIDELPDYRYFRIDPARLNPNKTAVYFKTAPGEKNVTVKWLADVNLDDLQNTPSATLKYYKSLVGSGELPFNYQFVPHILYRGSIDISDAEIITPTSTTERKQPHQPA